MKKLFVCLLALLMTLTLVSCGEKEKEKINAIPIRSAVCEDGKIVVTYEDGFRLELGDVNEMLAQSCVFLQYSVKLGHDNGEDNTSLKPSTATTTASVEAAVIAPDAEKHTLSGALFSGNVNTAERYGTQITFYSNMGGGSTVYKVVDGSSLNGVLGGNFAVAGNANGSVAIEYSTSHSYNVGVFNGNLNNYVVAVNGDVIMPDAYLLCDRGIYEPIDAAVIPLLKQYATSVTVPASTEKVGVTTVSSGAFRDFAALTSVTLPKTVKTLEAEVFAGCTALTEIRFDGTEEQWNAVTRAENWQGGRELKVTFAETQPSNP